MDKPKNEHDLYGLRYAEFTVPLVKAVQEQQQQIETLKQENAALRAQTDVLRQLLENRVAELRAEIQAARGISDARDR